MIKTCRVVVGPEMIEMALSYHNFIVLGSGVKTKIEWVLILIILSEYKYYPFIDLICKNSEFFDYEYDYGLINSFCDGEVSLSTSYFGVGNNKTGVEIDIDNKPINYEKKPYFKVNRENSPSGEDYKLRILFGSNIVGDNENGDHFDFLCTSNLNGLVVLAYYAHIPFGFEFYFKFDEVGSVLPIGHYKFFGKVKFYYTVKVPTFSNPGGVESGEILLGEIADPIIKYRKV